MSNPQQSAFAQVDKTSSIVALAKQRDFKDKRFQKIDELSAAVASELGVDAGRISLGELEARNDAWALLVYDNIELEKGVFKTVKILWESCEITAKLLGFFCIF